MELGLAQKRLSPLLYAVLGSPRMHTERGG